MTAKKVDVLLVGAGAMSSTLGTLLKQLDPSLTIAMVERLDQVAQESTDALNNAGTGHAAYCELNYTPVKADGSIDTTKAFNINSAFEVSLQLWSYLVEEGALPEPTRFINTAPHCSFVWGDENVDFLRKRYETLRQHHLFSDMEYSEDPAVINQWMPLVMQNRKPGEKVAASRVAYGSDVNFGELSRAMVSTLQQQEGFDLYLNTQVEDLDQQKDKSWQVSLKDHNNGKRLSINARFVFIGAGGAALTLLQKSGISEGKGYGGFPVSGQWLICNKPEIIEQHHAKVYGKPPLGAPPMSVPHLDTRVINGKKALLFGPFAGFTTRFLKKGSILDLPFSIRPNNLRPLMSVGINNMDLTRYLISESLQSHEARVASLRKFFPDAKESDWQLSIAGQRVQIIKKDEKGGGKLEFGTEVIVSSDKTISALLGASPGASTAAQAMLSVIERAMPQLLEGEGSERIRRMIPSYKQSLIDNAELLKTVRERTLRVLQLGETQEEAPRQAINSN
ncbi:malate dehydrogenase (quinone) [Marinospirillum alkaliphilum]|uniref:Probable malate:quinone oxidoreductase n=1 Tax=Marinospirillum alkaliphilum DSM 21637 TaxID=1122209 RepID=A0A1K2A049_9GAMM|nr:malate dehydrogenase (quinone) [Marinospirillum alkaliphilum]SFX79890.1 malate dehydrogenase (quinone) [Marinospirillum alkaliphilum DSM 21637]